MTDQERIADFLLKDVTRAIGQFRLIEDGDRVATAISGGRDSWSMLDLLLRQRRQVPYPYEILALHVVATEAGLPDLRPELRPWLRERGVESHFVPIDLPPGEPLPLDCFRCSWNRRKALFTATADLGCHKLALGHHADDAAVTALMNLLFHGNLKTMEPRVAFFQGAVTVIRPLIYLPQKHLLRYAKAAGYPDRPACPQGQQSQRAEIDRFLSQFGRRRDHIRTNLWRAAREAMVF